MKGVWTGVLILGLGLVPGAQAGWRDMLDGLMEDDAVAQTASVALSNDEVIAGLREALARGARSAVQSLGHAGGYLDNAAVRIPVPEKLEVVETGLRRLGRGQTVDAFIGSMNHAAEQAAPLATDVFVDAIKRMSIKDARGILNGPDNAATRYLKRSSSAALTQKMLPLVQQATQKVGVTRYYKDLIGRAGLAAQFVNLDSLDLDRYVTGKALDGLFLMMAAEEKRIREDPLARSTELLKKVFGGR